MDHCNVKAVCNSQFVVIMQFYDCYGSKYTILLIKYTVYSKRTPDKL